MSSIEIIKSDAKDLAGIKDDETPRSIGYTIAKYIVAFSPVYIPAILLYIITRDILITVVGTAVFDIALVAAVGLYVVSSRVDNKKVK